VTYDDVNPFTSYVDRSPPGLKVAEAAMTGVGGVWLSMSKTDARRH
jgi:hypothetical protein